MHAQRIDDILRDAYAVFETSAPAGLNVCTSCCIDPATEQAMRTGHASAISDRDLAEWSNAAYISETLPQKICTFLAPRVMQAVFRPSDLIEETFLLGRVPFGGADQWTAAQNDVIQRFFHGYLAQYRDNTQVEPFLDDVLCMLCASGFRAGDILAVLNAWSDADLINRLWLASAVWSDGIFWQSVSWDFFKGTRMPAIAHAHNAVLDWYRSPDLKDRIDRYLATADPETNTWSRAAEVEVALVRMRARV